MTFNGTTVNCSPTICAAAKSVYTGGPYKAVAYEDGQIVACTDTLTPAGLTITETSDTIPAGDDVHFQIKDIGVWKAGGTFSAGDALASDANGCAVKAAAGAYILGYALETCAAEGQVIPVQITKSGYAKA